MYKLKGFIKTSVQMYTIDLENIHSFSLFFLSSTTTTSALPVPCPPPLPSFHTRESGTICFCAVGLFHLSVFVVGIRM